MEETLINKNKGNIVKGVGLIIINNIGQIATILEKEEKDRKNSGQISIPFGTAESTDDDDKATIMREIKQELGIQIDGYMFSNTGKLLLDVPGREDNIVVNTFCMGLQDNIPFSENDDYMKQEVGNRKRTNISDLLNKDYKSIRPGTYEAILLALNKQNKTGIIDNTSIKVEIQNGQYEKNPIDIKKQIFYLLNNNFLFTNR